MTLTVPCASGLPVTATYPLTHLCPHRDETDNGRVEITWTCAGSTIELHALGAWLAGFAGCRVSHEDITSQITAGLSTQPGIAGVRVVTRWDTAGAEVVVTGDLPGNRELAGDS